MDLHTWNTHCHPRIPLARPVRLLCDRGEHAPLAVRLARRLGRPYLPSALRARSGCDLGCASRLRPRSVPSWPTVPLSSRGEHSTASELATRIQTGTATLASRSNPHS